MCHDPDSRPPIAPLAGAAVEHADLVLEPPDGNRFAAPSEDAWRRTLDFIERYRN